jgi:co-chaperonin GroES (HSP10)
MPTSEGHEWVEKLEGMFTKGEAMKPEPNRLASCPIEPMPGFIVVQPDINSDNVTFDKKTRLFKVSLAVEKPSHAPIVAIGDDTNNEEVGFTFNLGDEVLFSIHSGMKVNFGERGNELYIVLAAKLIIGRLVSTEAHPILPDDHD